MSNFGVDVEAIVQSLSENEKKSIRLDLCYEKHNPDGGIGTASHNSAVSGNHRDFFMAQALKFAHLGLYEILEDKRMLTGEDSSAKGEIYAVIKRLTPLGVKVGRRLVERKGLPDGHEDVMPKNL